MDTIVNNRTKNNLEIIEIYKKLEAELSSINPGCNACGTCCHFDEFNHVLYASTIETDYILDNVEVPPFDTDGNVCLGNTSPGFKRWGSFQKRPFDHNFRLL